MASHTRRFTADGREYTLQVLSGTVEKTEQRSDTYVSGGSNPNAAGAPNISISSTVVVTRDIWLREETGEERHLRIRGDIPVRDGQYIHYVWLAGPELISGTAPLDYGLVNLSVNESWHIMPSRVLAHRWFLWAFGVAGLVSLAFGLLGSTVMIAFLITWYMSSRRRKRLLTRLKAELTPLADELRNLPPPVVARAAAS